MFDKLFEGNNLYIVLALVAVFSSKNLEIPNELAMLIVGVFICMLYTKKNTKENFDVDSSLGNEDKVDLNLCSPDCCGTQWPVAHMITDKRVKQGVHLPSNFSCTGTKGSGCQCLTKEQTNYLANHGGNHTTCDCINPKTNNLQ